MNEHWQTYRVTGHYVKPRKEPQTVLVEYVPGGRIGSAVAFDTTIYCPNPLEVHQHARRKIAKVEGVPYANVTVERVEVVR